MSKTMWSRYEYVGSEIRMREGKLTGGIQLEDIKRHINASGSQRWGQDGSKPKVPRDKHHDLALKSLGKLHPQVCAEVGSREIASGSSSSSTDAYIADKPDFSEGMVPSPEQIALAYEVAWEMAGQINYEKRCQTERQRGANIPWVRDSRGVGTKTTIAAAEVALNFQK